MPKWLIQGIDRSTGRDVETIIDAPDSAALRAEADRRLILIKSIDPTPDPTPTDPATDPTLQYASPTTLPPRPSQTAVPTASVHYATARTPDVDARTEALAAARLFQRLARVCLIAGLIWLAGDGFNLLISLASDIMVVGNFTAVQAVNSLVGVVFARSLSITGLILLITSAALRAAAAFTLTYAAASRPDSSKAPPDA